VVAASLLAAVEEGDRLGSMALYFLVAVAVIGPYGVMRVRRILRERAELAAATAPPVDPDRADGADGPSPNGSPTASPDDDLTRAFEAIEAGTQNGAEVFEVRVPARPRLNGRPADAATVDALVQDALRRSKVVVVAEDSSPEGRVLTCKRGG
jgi:hypothetical protein